MNPVFLGIMFILAGFIALIFWAFSMQNKAKRELIEELWTNGDINETTYKKYLKKIK